MIERRHLRRACPVGSWTVFVGVFFAVGSVQFARGDTSVDAQTLLAREQTIADGLDEVDQRINEVVRAQEMLRLQRESRSRDVSDLDGRLNQLEAETDAQLSRLRRRLQLRRRASAGQTARWRLFLTADRPTSLVRRRGALASVLRADLSLLQTSREATDRVRALQRKREMAVADLTASEVRLQTQRQRLEEERGLKTEVLRRLRAERRLHRQVVVQRIAQRSSLEIPIREADSDNDFLAEKGRLPMPAKGRIVRRFGRHEDPELGTQTLSTGFLIDAPLGAPVRSVFDGRVVYSGWYKGYGNLVIVDHGAGYHTLYGHLLAISRARGEPVTQGGIIGEVGDTGSLRGPQLFFELRSGRQPVDPAPWMRSAP